LDWKEPIDGGQVVAYIRCSGARVPRANGPISPPPWSRRSPSTTQARAKELEFRVIAINKAGEGESSNSVMAAL